MIQSAAVRKIVLVLVLSLLIAPWASAAGTKTEISESFESGLQGLLVEAWSFIAILWGDEGCHIDPNGRCEQQTAPLSDTGCHIDPNGGGCQR
jgi:hypothetical protein